MGSAGFSTSPANCTPPTDAQPGACVARARSGYDGGMRALTIVPKQTGSLDVTEVPDPTPGEGELLVDGIAVGVCGTDKEIAGGGYGWAPPGRQRLVIGHESFGRVRTAPAGSAFAAGDLVAGVVRRPDPVPCGACAHGEFDMCRNGRYTERGIKQLDGYASEQWTVEADYAVKLDERLVDVGMLMEPTTVVAKAWEQVDRIGERSWFQPERCWSPGGPDWPAGRPDRRAARPRGARPGPGHRGPEAALVHALGATSTTSDIDAIMARVRPDVVIEATGSPDMVFGAMRGPPPTGSPC